MQGVRWSKEFSFGGKKVGVVMSVKGLDREWMELIKQAKEAGLTKEEIRQFLLGKKKGKDLQAGALEKVN